MSLFNGKYLSDEEIWQIINDIICERDDAREQLARPEVSTNPELMPELAKKLYQLDSFVCHLEDLKSCFGDLQELGELMSEEADENHLEELKQLYQEENEVCINKASEVYNILMDKGYINIEREDEMDLKILKFLDYAGAEYTWRLSINVNIDVEEARKRLEVLLSKGLIEKVQGTMLEGYHRQKDWVKHMNHTYYRMSRKGRHYLRELRIVTEELIDQNSPLSN